MATTAATAATGTGAAARGRARGAVARGRGAGVVRDGGATAGSEVLTATWTKKRCDLFGLDGKLENGDLIILHQPEWW